MNTKKIEIANMSFTEGQLGDLVYDLKKFLMFTPVEQWTLAHEELQETLKPFLSEDGN